MVRKNTFLSILFVMLLFFGRNASAFDDQNTHPDITDKAISNSKSEQYLVKNLGLKDGLKTSFPTKDKEKTIRNILKKGSTNEDTPNCRASNHFHNPLLSWNKSYMSDDDTFLANKIRDFCNVTGWPSLLRKSDVTWATGYLSPAPEGKKATFLTLATVYNWAKARNNYFKALTSSKNSDRDSNFAQTFETVGHILHLLQDVSVPAHVRNDFQSHLTFNEVAFQDPRKWANQPFEYFVRVNRHLVETIDPNGSVPTFTDKTLTNFWDTDQYTGSNPSSSTSLGLAEYTNANFLSDTTFFKGFFDPLHSFPYPAWASIQEYDETDPYTLEKTTYLRKVRDGDRIEHLAAGKWYYKYLPTAIKNTGLELDDKCHYDYAQKLLPRAIGYSAGLLDYFFRGDIRLDYETTPTPGYVFVNKTGERFDGSFQIYYDNNRGQRHIVWDGTGYLEAKMNDKTNTINLNHPVDAKEPGRYILVSKGNMGNEKGAVAGYVTSRLLEITTPEQFIYSMVDADNPTPQFTEIKVKIKNISAETMQNGTIQAVAKYKKTTDDSSFLFSVSTPKTGITLGTTAREFSFDFTGNPIPINVTDLYLEIVFKGTMGTEQEATAIGIKDISEPTPIDLFNNTDRSCLNNSWYISGSSAAIAQVDKNKDGDATDSGEWDIYPHILKNLYIKISSPANPQAASPSVNNFVVPELEAGRFKRAIYILTDDQFKYSVNTVWERKDPDDLWGHSNMTYLHSGTAVKNQTDYTSDPAICGRDILCYNYVYPADHFVRGANMWWGGGLVFISSPYPATSTCQGYE